MIPPPAPNSTDAVNDTTAQTTAPLTPEEQRQLVSDDLPEKDFGGREFNIISRTNFTYEFDVEQTGDTLDDALYARNTAVEERFNVKIVTHAYGEGNAANVMEPLEKSIMAADDAYQIGSAYTYKAAPGSLTGSFVNLYDVEMLNFDKPWWSKGFIEEASINGKVYLATGDISLLFNEVTLCMFFNKQMAEDLKLGNVYDTVRAGDWTYDLMKQWCTAAASDTNGDGKMDESDRWGIGVNRYTHVDCFLYAFEVPLSERGADGLPVLKINNEKMTSLVEMLNALFHESGTAYLCDDPVLSFKENMFENGQGLLMTSWLGNAATLRDMDADFGIIPYPKWDKAQKSYATYYLDRASSIVIPVTADLDFVGIIVEALAAESYKKVIPAFYDVTLKGKSARDNESQEMIDLIRENIRFDFANIYANSFGSDNPGHILRTLVWGKDTGFASYYASREDSYLTKLVKIIDMFDQ